MITSCKKAAKICCKEQYKEASFIEKIRLKFHLLVCKGCSKFSKKNSELTELCDKANLNALTVEDMEEMKECIKAEH